MLSGDSRDRRKLREMYAQNTVPQIMRGTDQFAWTDGCCKQSPHKWTNSITKTVEPMDLHTILLSSPYLLACGCVDFI